MKTPFSAIMTVNDGGTERKKRKVIRDLNSPHNNFAIDEHNYLVVREMAPEHRLLDRVPIQINSDGRCVVSFVIPYHVRFVPFSIGQLRDLTYLRIVVNENTRSLPWSIGQPQNLTELHMHCRGITSLPPTIGHLLKLEILDCFQMKNLESLPDEIGGLSRLKELDAADTGIASIPASIGRLQSLDRIFLDNLMGLSELPEDIGNLSRLEVLTLESSGIKSLPDSMGRLVGLKYLDLDSTDIPELRGDQDPTKYLLNLSQHFPSLGCVGRSLEKRGEKVCYELACNRSRSRVDWGKEGEVWYGLLWPHMLNQASRAYQSYGNQPLSYGTRHKDQDRIYTVPKTDAIYRFLVDGRESFICTLLHPA